MEDHVQPLSRRTGWFTFSRLTAGLLFLITGVADVAQVVFVRKRLVEIQYLRTTITDEQRREFGHLVENTIQQIESGCFLPHSGIRFPQNPCTSCPYVGLCLGRPELVQARLVRRPGDDLSLFEELAY